LGRILPLLGHVPDDGNLLGHTPLALGEVPVGLGEVFVFLLHVRPGPIMRLIAGASHHEFRRTPFRKLELWMFSLPRIGFDTVESG
jgi:hypothetical protein